MSQQKTLEEIVVEQADVVRHQIEEAADFAESEMDLQIEVAKALDHFSSVAHLPKLRAHHNVTIGVGRPDSVYGCVFIEYKAPGRLTEDNKSPANRELIKQLEDRPREFQKELKRDISELIGVGTDGRYFIFARQRGAKWEIGTPQPLSTRVVERVLRYLVGLGTAGKPFQPDYLAGDFGAESDRKLARDGIATLYARVREVEQRPDDFPKGKVLFDQWRILFGEVCGYDVNKLSPKIKELADFYGVHKNPNAAALLFAVHSYYALFMKFLAAEIATTFNPLSASFLQRLHQTGSSKRLQEELRELEDGGIYRQLGIKNFLEGDLFSWYLDAWDDHVEKVVRDMVACFDEYDAKTLVVEPEATRDLLKKLYQQLFPKTVRHDLGEYYTPDWLAELVMERVGYTGDPDKRVLDPACGSGTFLVMAINKIREYAAEHTIPKHQLRQKILANVVGFDLNPLAVMAARTNYVLALRDMLKLGGEIEIPVYLCDSILTPSEYGDLFTRGHGHAKEFKTAAARFLIPVEIAASREDVGKYSEQLEFCVRNGYSDTEFLDRCEQEGLKVGSRSLHTALYRELVKLDKAAKNGVWARIIKNAFAPLFVRHADFVVGNPPWVFWNNLPGEYREQVRSLMGDTYGIIAKGASTMRRLGQTGKDISMLFFYVALDKYLERSQGRLGFVITQTLCQSTAAMEFRQFQLPDRTPICLSPVDDLVDVDPFVSATNKTAVLCAHLGEPTSYPLPYRKWSVAERFDRESASLAEVLAACRTTELSAVPSSSDRRSFWMLGEIGERAIANHSVPGSIYKARRGVETTLESAFRVRILRQIGKGDTLLVENNRDRARIPVPKHVGRVERGLVYPYLTGESIRRWQAVPKGYYIVPHTAETGIDPISEPEMKRDYRLAYEFLRFFKPQLEQRSLYRRWGKGKPFYAMFDIGGYTFSPFRVAWKRTTRKFAAAVVGYVDDPSLGRVLLIPNGKIMFVPGESEEAAHFLCALLNSSPARSRMNRSISSEAHADIIRLVPLPPFNAREPLHRKLAALSGRAHGAAQREEEEAVALAEAEMDETAAVLWGIGVRELKRIQAALRETERRKRRTAE